MFNTEGYSLSDIAAVTDNKEDGMWGNGMSWWIIILFLFMFMGWGGNGFGGRNDGALTRAELAEGFNFQDLNSQMRGLTNGLSDGFYAVNNSLMQGFNGVQRDLCTGFSGINSNMNAGFANVNSALAENRYAQQACCCETNRNIDALRYENAKNTCEVVTNANMNTRDIIDANNAGIQRLADMIQQDKIQSLRDQLQTANFQLSQQAQNAYLIDQIRPCPTPAYLTCSPYAVYPQGCGCSN